MNVGDFTDTPFSLAVQRLGKRMRREPGEDGPPPATKFVDLISITADLLSDRQLHSLSAWFPRKCHPGTCPSPLWVFTACSRRQNCFHDDRLRMRALRRARQPLFMLTHLSDNYYWPWSGKKREKDERMKDDHETGHWAFILHVAMKSSRMVGYRTEDDADDWVPAETEQSSGTCNSPQIQQLKTHV